MISFIDNKQVDFELVQKLLDKSYQQNQWSNFGPVSLYLEDYLKEFLCLDNDLSVVMCSSGTIAIETLADLFEIIEGRKIIWNVCSFGFSCTKKNKFSNSKVIDCNRFGMMDVINEYSIVTNIFGTQKELRFKNCIIDSAMAFDNIIHHENEAISFHHTKPWGFGEGGCIIINREHEKLIRSIINFGLCSNIPSNYGFNGKMSDVAAAFILQHLITYKSELYKIQYERIKSIGKKLDINILGEIHCTPGHVPFLFNLPSRIIHGFDIAIKKYYKPIISMKIADLVYGKILNFPCHPGLEKINDTEIEEILEKLNE